MGDANGVRGWLGDANGARGWLGDANGVRGWLGGLDACPVKSPDACPVKSPDAEFCLCNQSPLTYVPMALRSQTPA